MARYDKYDPISGGFRAPLAANLTLTNGNFGPKAVSLNSSGKVVVGTAGTTGLVGILERTQLEGPGVLLPLRAVLLMLLQQLGVWLEM